MDGSAHTPITFMVYSIPNHADLSFLQMLFQQKIQRCVYFGSGPTRFALVELNDTTFEKHLAEAVHNHLLVHDAQAQEQEVEAAEAEVGNTERPVHRAVAYLLKVKWGTEPIHIVRSAVQIDDLYATGGVVRDYEPEDELKKREMNNKGRQDKRKGEYNNKRPREETSHAGGQTAAPAQPAHAFPKDCCQKCGSKDHFSRNCDGSGPGPAAAQAAAPSEQHQQQQTAEVASVSEPAAPKPSFPKDCCQKCGSKSHFTRNCDGSGAVPQAPAAPAPPAPASNDTSSSTPVPAAAKPSFPKNCCQKCGSADHFTRNCDGGHTAAPPAPQPQPQQPPKEVKAAPVPPPAPVEKAVQAAPPSFARTSKDQCKHCGSVDHLSRLCPNK